jgi:anti-anti-sigma regulatory factor
VAVVRIPAEMTLELTRAFRAYVAAALVEGDSIEVDLSELTEVEGLECGLLAAIVAADKSARAMCGRLMLLGVHGPVAIALSATGLDGRLDVGLRAPLPVAKI